MSLVISCQKSFNFINAFACYKQKCKLAPFNLAHPVCGYVAMPSDWCTFNQCDATIMPTATSYQRP